MRKGKKKRKQNEQVSGLVLMAEEKLDGKEGERGGENKTERQGGRERRESTRWRNVRGERNRQVEGLERMEKKEVEGCLKGGMGRGSGQVMHAGERRGCLLSVCLWRDGVCLVYWFVLPRVVLPVPPVSPRRTWSRYS